MTDDRLRGLQRTYTQTGAEGDRRLFARALRQARDVARLIALYEPLLIEDDARRRAYHPTSTYVSALPDSHRAEYFEESFIRPEDREDLGRLLQHHDTAGMRTYLVGDALERQDYTWLTLICEPTRDEQPTMDQVHALMRQAIPPRGIVAPQIYGLTEGWRFLGGEPGQVYNATVKGTPFQLEYHRRRDILMPERRMRL